ncbi:MAG: endonuclease [Pirellulales bacterium]|nr:endonuclease [Pirellulales bacterium]
MSQSDIKSQLRLKGVGPRFRDSAGEREFVKEQIKIGKSPVEIERVDRVERRVADLGIGTETAENFARSFKEAVDTREARTLPRPKNPGLERIIGENDLLSSVFLERGAEATKSVCCIQENYRRIGTGFLVTPRLLLTNSHVIGDPATAMLCMAEFNYEDRLIGVGMETSVPFKLAPQALFFSSPEDELDYTLVAVEPISVSGSIAISDFGFLRLETSVANALRGECLNILQHPNGAPKRLALRQNRFTALLERYVHYESDTLPGSSGSPVFNDQWQVICLHHAGVPLKDSKGNILTSDNRIWNPDTDDPNLIKWIGNEGIRISRIVADVIRQVAKKHGNAWPAILAEFPRETNNPPYSEEQLGDRRVDEVPPSEKHLAPGNDIEQPIYTNKCSVTAHSLTVTVSVGDSTPVVVTFSHDTPDRVRTWRKSSVKNTDTGDTRTESVNLVERGLLNLERSQTRTYYEKERDKTSRANYYRDIDPRSTSLFDDLNALVTQTHKQQLSYKVARIEHLYAWVDLQRDKKVRSIYSDERFNPKQFIKEDFGIERHLEQLIERRSLREGNRSPEALERMTAMLEAQQPFNCEHVVPQSWFGNDAPMQGDLHHLFTCQSQCNSFRGNRPYNDFGKFSIAQEADRPKCGFSDDGLFEPFMGKGKVARATLYFFVRYRGHFENMYEDVQQGLETLLDWHEGTPVTEHELHRNQAIADIQKNRNPFIDHPDWARLVFKD